LGRSGIVIGRRISRITLPPTASHLGQQSFHQYDIRIIQTTKIHDRLGQLPTVDLV
jgi:hypothetical protein